MDLPEIPKVDTFKNAKADFTHCPLCFGKWKTYEEPGKHGKVYFFCEIDLISIHIRDKMLGRWNNVEKEPCPFCGEKMRLFFRSDGYIKMICPKCKGAIETVDPDKHAAMLKKEEKMGIRKTVRPQKRFEA